jgi:predicted Holliday junction resolvase-like endonuclease
METGLTILVLVLILVVVALVAALRHLKKSIPDTLERAREEEREAFRKRSAPMLVGNAVQHYVPFLEEFPYHPSDARFLGGLIDFVVFDGLTNGEVRAVIFVEVKKGNQAPSKRQRQVEKCVQDGKVDFITLQVHSTGRLRVKRSEPEVEPVRRPFEPLDEATRELLRLKYGG